LSVKFNEGDRVLFLRSGSVDDSTVYRDYLGTIVNVSSREDNPYKYKAEFEITYSDSGSTDTEPYSVTEKRNLFWQQIAVISDSTELRLRQIIRINHPRMRDETSDLALLRAFETIEGLAYLKVLTPNRGNWRICLEDYRDSISPLTEERLTSLPQTVVRKFLRKIANIEDFIPDRLERCIDCSEWMREDELYKAQGIGSLCEPCQRTHEYDCEWCHKTIQLRRVPSRYYEGELVCRYCYDERVFKCNSCNRSFSDKKSFNYDGVRYCDPCYNNRATSILTSPPRMLRRDILAKLSIPPDKLYGMNRSRTPVAVEIEAIPEFNDDISWDGYPTGWTDVHDTSIDDESGREFIMVPEIGDDAFALVKSFCLWANDNDFYVNNSCGLHVHTDGYYIGVQGLKGILLTVKALEPFIYDMLPPNRSKNRYSPPMDDGITSDDILSISSAKDLSVLWYESMNSTEATTDKYNSSRYRGLNIHSRFLHGTIEYRYHHGTLNSYFITKWMAFCLGMSDFGARFLERDDKIKNLFIKNESNDFSDYLSAMNMDDLIPYVEELRERNADAHIIEKGAEEVTSGSWENARNQSQAEFLRDIMSDPLVDNMIEEREEM
jgi:hypothetical protein